MPSPDFKTVCLLLCEAFLDYESQIRSSTPLYPTDLANTSVCTHLQLFAYIELSEAGDSCTFCSPLKLQHAEPGSLIEQHPHFCPNPINHPQSDVLGSPCTTQVLFTVLGSETFYYYYYYFIRLEKNCLAAPLSILTTYPRGLGSFSPNKCDWDRRVTTGQDLCSIWEAQTGAHDQ